MKKKVEIVPINQNDIKSRMLVVRNQAVLLDRDVAALYQVQTREINQAVRNNPEKFPLNYVFQLGKDEFEKDLPHRVRIHQIYHSLACIDKAKTLLGYAPEFSVKQGLKAATRWYFENLQI